VEETKPIVEVDSPITKRKNRKNNNVETTTVTPSPSVKKSKPRRFVWTLNKVLIFFGLFTIITISLIIYMFKQIA
jgi:predicted secreted protein